MLQFIVVIVATIILIYQTLRKRPHLPPGPVCFPLVGFMPFFAYKPLARLKQLASYGELSCIYLGQYRVIVLNSTNAIKEAFKDDALSGRPNLKMFELRNGGVHKGLVCSEGNIWIEQRRFTLKRLKELGFGKRGMEELLHEEVDELVAWLGEHAGAATSASIDLKPRLNLAVLNALWRIIAGKRYPHDDRKLQQILKMTSADITETNYTGPLLFLPSVLKLAPRLTRLKDFKISIQNVHCFLKEIIAEHKNHNGERGNCDFIDMYLTEIETAGDPDSSFYKNNGEHSLLVVLLDLLMAGSDTTSATLYWAFLYMSLHENVQRNVQDEIDAVVGNSTPRLEDRKLMPYTEATILEVLRKSSLVPMGLFHSAIVDTKLFGYDIPKDTVIMANLYNVHRDPKVWGDPDVFRPQRFLNRDGTKIITARRDSYLPFSTGKRKCLGENLARDEIFIFLVGILQKFFLLPDPKTKLCDEPNYGVILSARPYSVVVRSRVIGGV